MNDDTGPMDLTELFDGPPWLVNRDIDDPPSFDEFFEADQKKSWLRRLPR